MTIFSPQNETPGQTDIRSQCEFRQFLRCTRRTNVAVTVINGLTTGQDAEVIIDIILYDARDARQPHRARETRRSQCFCAGIVLEDIVVIQDNG